jgi:hypothetical protein
MNLVALSRKWFYSIGFFIHWINQPMSSPPVNSSEEFVHYICKKSFLSLWCYNNPRGKKGKELCDILVVCNPYVLIISVKDIRLKETIDSIVDLEKWKRRAVDSSTKQIYGAERWLQSAKQVICNDGSLGVELPSVNIRKTYRIAVAFGSRDEVSLNDGNFGRGFIHVITESSFFEIFTELDTIEDFIGYIRDKEAFLTTQRSIINIGTESDLLGIYLYNGRTFPSGPDLLIVQDDIWKEIQLKPEFKARKIADEESYIWDKLIEIIAGDESQEHPEYGFVLNDRERAVRGMARENRFSRRLLGKGFLEFIRLAKEGKVRSRALRSYSGAVYVFIFFRKDTERQYRISELTARCLIARSKFTDANNILTGIGISEYDTSIGSYTDIVFMEFSDWTPDTEYEAKEMEKEFKFFHKQPLFHVSQDEYPT